MYPLTLGSNIGTTTTALLASLSADPSMLRSSVQVQIGLQLQPYLHWELFLSKEDFALRLTVREV